MKATILQRLNELEEQHGIHIYYAVESGSRAWGFASLDSDYDVRFLYHYPQNSYLQLYWQDEVLTIQEDDLDLHGWDLFKALHLLHKGNPSLFEWLYSPIVYTEKGSLVESLRTLATTYFPARQSFNHYLNLAQEHIKKHLNTNREIGQKPLLYIMRSLLCLQWIAQYQTQPPIKMHDLLVLDIPNSIENELVQLIEQKERGKEQDLHKLSVEWDAFIRERVETYTGQRTMLSRVVVPTDTLNTLILQQLQS